MAGVMGNGGRLCGEATPPRAALLLEGCLQPECGPWTSGGEAAQLPQDGRRGLTVVIVDQNSPGKSWARERIPEG